MVKTTQRQISEYNPLAAAIFFTALCIFLQDSAPSGRARPHGCFIPAVSLRWSEFLSPFYGLRPQTAAVEGKSECFLLGSLPHSHAHFEFQQVILTLWLCVLIGWSKGTTGGRCCVIGWLTVECLNKQSNTAPMPPPPIPQQRSFRRRHHLLSEE